MGRGPKEIRTHLIEDFLIVRLRGVLTAAEQHLVAKLPAEKGRDLLKQVRSQLTEIARPRLEELVEELPVSSLLAYTTTLERLPVRRSSYSLCQRLPNSAKRGSNDRETLE